MSNAPPCQFGFSPGSKRMARRWKPTATPGRIAPATSPGAFPRPRASLWHVPSRRPRPSEQRSCKRTATQHDIGTSGKKGAQAALTLRIGQAGLHKAESRAQAARGRQGSTWATSKDVRHPPNAQKPRCSPSLSRYEAGSKCVHTVSQRRDAGAAYAAGSGKGCSDLTFFTAQWSLASQTR
jgi:hypothetical protein